MSCVRAETPHRGKEQPAGSRAWCRPLLRFVQLDSKRRFDRAAAERWFRREAAVLTSAPVRRPERASSAYPRRRPDPSGRSTLRGGRRAGRANRGRRSPANRPVAPVPPRPWGSRRAGALSVGRLPGCLVSDHVATTQAPVGGAGAATHPPRLPRPAASAAPGASAARGRAAPAAPRRRGSPRAGRAARAGGCCRSARG